MFPLDGPTSACLVVIYLFDIEIKISLFKCIYVSISMFLEASRTDTTFELDQNVEIRKTTMVTDSSLDRS